MLSNRTRIGSYFARDPYLLNTPKSFMPKKLHTEYVTLVGAEHEIKKLLENYVDLELKSFYELKKEKEQAAN